MHPGKRLPGFWWKNDEWYEPWMHSCSICQCKPSGEQWNLTYGKAVSWINFKFGRAILLINFSSQDSLPKVKLQRWIIAQLVHPVPNVARSEIFVKQNNIRPSVFWLLSVLQLMFWRNFWNNYTIVAQDRICKMEIVA